MQNKKVLLIYPGHFGALFPEIPLPLLYIAWALRKKDVDVEIFDARLQNINTIENKDYLFVGITSMTGEMLSSAIKAAKYIRNMNPAIPIVWGGVHVSLLPEQSLKSPYVDIVVSGEGELTVQELAETLLKKENLSQVQGISFKHKGVVFTNPDRKFMDLDEIDIELSYDLIDLKRYSNVTFPMHTSRGCPWKCAFCYNLVFNKRRYRAKSVERVLDEIEYVVKKMGYSKLSFSYDDEFFINLKWAKAICQGIIDRNLNIEWDSFCRFDSFCHIDDETLDLIERSGCIGLSFGGESGSTRIRNEIIKKGITTEQMLETTKRLSKRKITQVVSFMSGTPTETIHEQHQTFELLNKLISINPNNLHPNAIVLYTPFPGTPLYELVIREYGFVPPQSLEKWAEYGIFRNVGNTWSSKKYLNRCKTISILTRFPFYRSEFALKDVSSKIASTRFSKFPFNVVYYVFTKLAIWRWKYKFFRFPIEFLLLEKVLLKLRGFV